MPDDDALDRLRAICLALPETSERVSHGEPSWFIREKKQFATFSDHHHDDRLACWLAAPPGTQEVLLGEAPGRFFRPPYVGHRGWVGVWFDVPDVDWDEVAELVTDAWRHVAPKTLVVRLDEGA